MEGFRSGLGISPATVEMDLFRIDPHHIYKTKVLFRP
jgi:hypothetical protein